MVFFTPGPFYPPKKEPSVLLGQEFVWTPSSGLVALETRTLASAGRRIKVRLTSCPQCIHYTHYSLPAPYREYLVRFPSVLSLKLRLLQECLLHLLDILSISLNLSADQILPVAV